MEPSASKPNGSPGADVTAPHVYGCCEVDGNPVEVEDVQAGRIVAKIAQSAGLRDSPLGRVSDRG
jgi:hypothetical protein